MSPRTKRNNSNPTNGDSVGGTIGADNHEDKKKIISVTINQSLVRQIDHLVNDRIARSRAQLIEDAVRWFINFTVHKWSERGVYVKGCRVSMEPDAQSSLFFSMLTPASQYELGKTAGSQSPVKDMMTITYRLDPSSSEGRMAVIKILQELGWGSIEVKDEHILIGSPFYPVPFLQGFLESLMKITLEPLETHAKDNAAFRIVS